jgi:peptidoglycan glycosyltransferase
LKQVAWGISGLFISVALIAGYWAVGRSAVLAERSDNPRNVLFEERIVRGRILDVDRMVLAGLEVLPDGSSKRTHPVPQAAPVVGYVSLRYGTSGIELAFNETLRGDQGVNPLDSAVRETLHRPQQGNDVQLTLDATLQTEAQDNLEGYTGAIVVMDAQTGEILALASSPTFNPDAIDEDWEALTASSSSPLINRATQGLYQPGTALQTVIVSELLAEGLATVDTALRSVRDPVPVNGVQLTCSDGEGTDTTLGDAYRDSCPAPFPQLAELIGADNLSNAFARWHLTTPISLSIPTDAVDWNSAQATVLDVEYESIGQGELIVSPLHMALVAATLANDGVMPVPHLVSRIQDQDGIWNEYDLSSESKRIIPSQISRDVLDEWNVHQDILVRQSTAIAGSSQDPHQWFSGVTTNAARFVVTVLLEDAVDTDAASSIGMSLLRGLTARD